MKIMRKVASSQLKRIHLKNKARKEYPIREVDKVNNSLMNTIIIVKWIMICKNIKMQIIIILEVKVLLNLWTIQSVKTALTHLWTLPNYKTRSISGKLSRITVKVPTTLKRDCIIYLIIKISGKEVITWCTQTTKPSYLMIFIKWITCKE